MQGFQQTGLGPAEDLFGQIPETRQTMSTFTPNHFVTQSGHGPYNAPGFLHDMQPDMSFTGYPVALSLEDTQIDPTRVGSSQDPSNGNGTDFPNSVNGQETCVIYSFRSGVDQRLWNVSYDEKKTQRGCSKVTAILEDRAKMSQFPALRNLKGPTAKCLKAVYEELEDAMATRKGQNDSALDVESTWTLSAAGWEVKHRYSWMSPDAMKELEVKRLCRMK